MPSVQALIGAHRRGDAGSLRALAKALAVAVEDVDELPTDPVALEEWVDTRPAVQADTWQEVVAARDYGDLTPAEFDYLVAAVEALTDEEEHDDGR